MVREFPNLYRFCSSFPTELMFDFMITILQALFPPLQKPKDLNTQVIEISSCLRTSLDRLAITEAL